MKDFKIYEIVESKLKQHDKLTTWKILSVETGLSGKKRYYCEAMHDTKTNFGFNKIYYEFKCNEIKPK
jgi:hypothetical protein|tara:strand:- start:186 stop:389 length:204 start_codon:yes stop_codon:yes gene_type:complete